MPHSGPVQAPPKAPLVLLGLLTVTTLAGPLVILAAVMGGEKSTWPPDRPIEWWALWLAVAAEVVLMLGCVTSGVWAKPTGKPRENSSADIKNEP